MAKTAFATNNALTKKLWEASLFEDTKKESYFSRFFGSTSASMVQEGNYFTKSKGDNVAFGIRMRLAGTGVTSGQTLEGNEEALTTYSFNMSLEEYAHAVRDRGPLDRQRAMFSIDEESQSALKVWGGEKIDKLCFDALVAGMTNSYTPILYTTSGTLTKTTTRATAYNAVAATDKLTPELISAAKAWAVTGGDRGQTPLRPVKVDGKNYFVLAVHPDVMYDLKQDATFAQARREALDRGESNPIFSGSSAIWDGVVIHEHENITKGSGTSTTYAENLFLGAQSLCIAFGQRPKVVAEEFDYGREHGFSIQMMLAVAAPNFNSKTYGSMVLTTARTNISGL